MSTRTTTLDPIFAYESEYYKSSLSSNKKEVLARFRDWVRVQRTSYIIWAMSCTGQYDFALFEVLGDELDERIPARR
jgi:hypothetical protein